MLEMSSFNVDEIKRSLFFNSLNDLINDMSNDYNIGLIIIDIEGFRNVNGSLGFEKGDHILVETLNCLKNTFLNNKYIFRIGNDEFAVILPKLLSANMINIAANKSVKDLAHCYHTINIPFKLSVNVGSAYLSEHSNADDLLIEAEKSLAAARKSGQAYLVRDFTEENNEGGMLTLVSEMHDALSNNTLELFYQPKINLKSGLPTHAEALSRWESPSSGQVSPEVFIPIVEKMGRMDDLTKWALNTALRQLKEWPLCWGGLSVAVNVCPSLIDSPDFLKLVTNIIAIWGVDPSMLTLEVTENAIIGDKETGFENLLNFKKQNIKISIDDFGTGYSSLSYFKDIPADELKIDCSFISHMMENEEDRHIVQVIVDLAHKFNLSVVAEGVESKETLHALIDIGCDYAQGFYFSKPLPQNQFIDWLKQYDCNNYF